MHNDSFLWCNQNQGSWSIKPALNKIKAGAVVNQEKDDEHCWVDLVL